MIAAQKLFTEIESLLAEYLTEVYEFVVCLKSKKQRQKDTVMQNPPRKLKYPSLIEDLSGVISVEELENLAVKDERVRHILKQDR